MVGVLSSGRREDGQLRGVDWASEKHDVLVADETGGRLVVATFAHDESGLRSLCVVDRIKRRLLDVRAGVPGWTDRPAARSRGWAVEVLWIDGLTTALSVGALRATLVFQQALSHESGQPVTVATALAYPPGDMILLAAVFGALARMGWRADRVWLLLGGEI